MLRRYALILKRIYAMTELTWSNVRNKREQCVEFAACHENFAWRKHHSSRFGQLKNQAKKCADDSLSRAFISEQDSIPLLFSSGNRVLERNPEYGTPKFAVVWYADEDWAILCTRSEATLIASSEIRDFKRTKEGAQGKLAFLTGLWESSDPSLRRPLTEVATIIA